MPLLPYMLIGRRDLVGVVWPPKLADVGLCRATRLSLLSLLPLAGVDSAMVCRQLSSIVGAYRWPPGRRE